MKWGAALAAITVVALALRLPRLWEALFGDELFTFFVSTRPTLGDTLRVVAGDVEITPPLYFAVAHLFAQLGDPSVMVRLPALIVGVACVPLIYLVGKRAFGRTAGLVGAALWALSPFAVSFSVEARTYTLMTALVLLSAWALLTALEDGRRRWWVLFAFCAAGAMLSHYTALLLLAPQAAWAVWAHRDRLRALVAAHAGAVVLFAPWLPYVAEDRSSGYQKAIGMVFPFTAGFVKTSFIRWLGGDNLVPPSTVPGVPGAILLGLGALLLVAGLVVLRHRRPSRKAVLIALLAIAAPAGTVLVSMVADSIFVPRTLLASLPYLFLAIGGLLTVMPRRLAVAAGAAVALALAFGSVRMLDPDLQRPQWNAVAEQIDTTRKPGDPVLELFMFSVELLDPYLHRPYEDYRAPCNEPTTAPGQVFLRRVRCGKSQGVRQALTAARGRRLFVITAPGEKKWALRGLQSTHRLVRTQEFPGSGRLTLRTYDPTRR